MYGDICVILHRFHIGTQAGVFKLFTRELEQKETHFDMWFMANSISYAQKICEVYKTSFGTFSKLSCILCNILYNQGFQRFSSRNADNKTENLFLCISWRNACCFRTQIFNFDPGIFQKIFQFELCNKNQLIRSRGSNLSSQNH